MGRHRKEDRPDNVRDMQKIRDTDRKIDKIVKEEKDPIERYRRLLGKDDKK